jgi:hypothetical protein
MQRSWASCKGFKFPQVYNLSKVPVENSAEISFVTAYTRDIRTKISVYLK